MRTLLPCRMRRSPKHPRRRSSNRRCACGRAHSCASAGPRRWSKSPASRSAQRHGGHRRRRGPGSTLAAARAGKRLLLANKEALVMAGPLLMQPCASRRRHAAADRQRAQRDLPVPAGEYARGEAPPGVKRILLTASGGPFPTRSRAPDARHAGAGLRASELGHGPQDLGRLGHPDEQGAGGDRGLPAVRRAAGADRGGDPPESIVHSLVEYVDGSVLAQLGSPDMRTPDRLGLAWPERLGSGVEFLDLISGPSIRRAGP